MTTADKPWTWAVVGASLQTGKTIGDSGFGFRWSHHVQCHERPALMRWPIAAKGCQRTSCLVRMRFKVLVQLKREMAFLGKKVRRSDGKVTTEDGNLSGVWIWDWATGGGNTLFSDGPTPAEACRWVLRPAEFFRHRRSVRSELSQTIGRRLVALVKL